VKVKKSLDSDCLALEGGQPIVDYTYSTWPAYSHDEINAVQEVLRSGKVNYWTGNIGQQFQQAFLSKAAAKRTVPPIFNTSPNSSLASLVAPQNSGFSPCFSQ